MKIIPGNAQHIGTRKEQQDDFGLSDVEDELFLAHGGVFAVLADGMGGHKMGAQASRTAVRVMRQSYENKAPEESVPDALERSLHRANQAVLDMARENDLADDVGTTLVAIVVHDGLLHWISVGDSHLYLFRDGGITQLNVDHVFFKDLDREVHQGKLTQKEADNHPDRNALTSYVGGSRINKIDKNKISVSLTPRDCLLLCSDGLYRTLSNGEIARTLMGDPQEAAEALIHKVSSKQRPNQDNTTVVVLNINPDTVSGNEALPPPSFWTVSVVKLSFLIFLLIVLGMLVFQNRDDMEALFNSPHPTTGVIIPVKEMIIPIKEVIIPVKSGETPAVPPPAEPGDVSPLPETQGLNHEG